MAARTSRRTHKDKAVNGMPETFRQLIDLQLLIVPGRKNVLVIINYSDQ